MTVLFAINYLLRPKTGSVAMILVGFITDVVVVASSVLWITLYTG